MTATATRRPRTDVIEHVIAAAKDSGDRDVLDAARRLAWADLLGWDRHADRRDVRLVWAFADAS